MTWIALQISTLKDDSGISTECILGAQNVVFASDATRNARFLSPAAVQATASTVKKLTNVSQAQNLTLGDPAPVTGWWFRDVIGDTNSFPRVGVASHSPGERLYIISNIFLTDVVLDIQPVGTLPDSNVVADLS